MAEDKSSKNTIILTGFGPFGPHKVNDSWECVKKLKELNIEDELGITLVSQKLPVMYAACEKYVPYLWKTYDPVLVIHVGVHNTESIMIERVGRKMGYEKPDITGSSPSTGCCPFGREEIISTCLELNDIIKSVDSRGMHLAVSENAGSYLCEYTYYMSLCQDSSKTLFIHIPPAGTSPSIEDKTLVLKNIIVAVYRQLKNFSLDNQ